MCKVTVVTSAWQADWEEPHPISLRPGGQSPPGFQTGGAVAPLAPLVLTVHKPAAML